MIKFSDEKLYFIYDVLLFKGQNKPSHTVLIIITLKYHLANKFPVSGDMMGKLHCLAISRTHKGVRASNITASKNQQKLQCVLLK